MGDKSKTPGIGLDIDKLRFVSEIETELKRLNFQRVRILSRGPQESIIEVTPTHDADFYIVLLRRLYRQVEKYAKSDSRVANLKGKFRELTEKIKIRDHFEHDVDLEKIPDFPPGIKIVTGLVINKESPHIISGNSRWLLNEDHESFVRLIEKFSLFYPFKPEKAPKKKTGKNLLIVLSFILPPVIFAILHIRAITISDSAVIPPGTLTITGSSGELPQSNPQEIDETEFRVRDTARELIPKLNNISRYSFFLSLQPNVIRHTLILDHTLSAKFEYADNPNGQDIKQERFPFTLSCVSNKVERKALIVEDLRLNDENDNDRELVEKVIKDCLYFPFGGFGNNSGRTLYLYDIDKSSFEGKVNLTIKPDLISTNVIFIGWYIFWIGSLILLRDGPGKYLKFKTKKQV